MKLTTKLILLVISFAAVVAQVTVQNSNNAPDVPGFVSNYRRIQAGSLIIPMDPATQVLVPKIGTMSVLPYGLVIRTLHANVTVAWAINTGKSLNGIDFTATTSRSTWAALAAAGTAAGDLGWSGWQQTGVTSYSGGPFIVPKQYVSKVLQAWNNWRTNPSAYLLTVDKNVYNTVNVHVLTQDTTIDIRHNIYTRPFIGVSNLAGNAGTQTAMMGCIYQAANRDLNACPLQKGSGAGALFAGGQAGCTAFYPQDHAGLDWGVHYTTYDCSANVTALTKDSCLSTFSEPHWSWDTTSGPSYISAIRNFVYSGANFLAQCASVNSYESYGNTGGTGTFMADNGITALRADSGINNQAASSQNTITNYPDLPINQYNGEMSSITWGAVPDFFNTWPNQDATPAGWQSEAGVQPTSQGYNNFKSSAFPLVTNVYNSAGDRYSRGRNVYVASGAKYNAQNVLGSNVFYLGGHSWVNLSNAGCENNRRFFFNAILIPAARPPSCGFSFCAVGSSCDNPPDVCTTCQCDPSGSGFIYAQTPGCCVNNTQCPDACTRCNLNSNTCELITGCCTTTRPCNTSCTSCQNINAATGEGRCEGSDGCCTDRANCTTTSACINCVNNTCVQTDAPACCDLPQQCTGSCQTCTNNTCARIEPRSTCCLEKGDCGTDPCITCDSSSRQCVSIPGCCNTNAQCGTSACVACNTTTNKCYNVPGCCTVDNQCGTCQSCNSSNVCGPSADASCCAADSDCGSCRRCAPGAVVGTKSCVPIVQCCNSQADCELCQTCNTTSNQCVSRENCCVYDSDCGASSCRICNANFTCEDHFDLSCCRNDNDCEVARQQLQNNPNATDIPACDLICYVDPSAPTNSTGVCQSVCSSGKNWTGLIVGLAAGVPLGLLFLLAIAAGIILFLLWKKDAITGALLTKGAPLGANAQSNPAFVDPVTIGSTGF